MHWRILRQVFTFTPTIRARIERSGSVSHINLISGSSPAQAADREAQIHRRANGDVGVRNELWILPTGQSTASRGRSRTVFWKRPTTPKVMTACSATPTAAQLGDDQDNTRTMLQTWCATRTQAQCWWITSAVKQPVAAFRETLGDIDPERVHFMIHNSRMARSKPNRASASAV